MRILRLAIVGSQSVSVQFAADPSVPRGLRVVLGPNESGKSLLTHALKVAFTAGPEQERARGELAEAGYTRIEVDFEHQDRHAHLVCPLPDGPCETVWEPNLEPLESTGPDGYSTPNGRAGTAHFEPGDLFPAVHVVEAGRLALPEGFSIARAVERVLRLPLERELAGWQARLTELNGDDHGGGKLADAYNALDNAASELRRIEDLQDKLATARHRREGLEGEIAETFARVQLLQAEAEELDRLAAQANRYSRLETWVNELRHECFRVLGLREQHEYLQDRLDQLDVRFRGVPDEFAALLDQYAAARQQEQELCEQVAVLETDRQRTTDEIARLQTELDNLTEPDDSAAATASGTMREEIESANAELTALLRSRIELIRQREGLERQIQHEFGQFAALPPELHRALVLLPEDEPAVREAPAEELSNVHEFRSKLEHVEEQLRTRFSAYPPFAPEATQRVREFHEAKRIQATLRSDLDGLRARAEAIRRRARPHRAIIWSVIGALVAFGAATYAWSWDLGVLAAVVGSGLVLLAIRPFYRKLEHDLESTVAAEAMTVKRLDESAEAVYRTQQLLGPLSIIPTLEEALQLLADYRYLSEERDRLRAMVSEWNRVEAQAEAGQQLSRAMRDLPEPLRSMPLALLRRNYQNYQRAVERLTATDAEWQSHNEGGVCAERVRFLEDRLAALSREHAARMLDGQRARQLYDERRAALTSQRSRLAAQQGQSDSLADRQNQLAAVRRQLTELDGAVGGLLHTADLETLRADWAEREQMRQRLREVRRELSGHQTVDELRARETLLAEEAAEVRQRLTSRDPLYLLHGNSAEYAAKYAGHGQAVRESISVAEGERRLLQTELAEVDVEALADEFASERPLEDLRQELQLYRDRVESLERDLTTTRELVAAIESELEEIGAAVPEQLQDAISRRLRALSGDRFRTVSLASDGTVTAADGTVRRLSALSDGAADLVRIAVRLGILDTVRTCDASPLVWDEALSRLDDAHLRRVREALSAFAAERQVILFSRHSHFESWGLVTRLSAAVEQSAALS